MSTWGITGSFEIEEVVSQGTIYGSTLCSIPTDRINKMRNQKPFVIGDVEIKYPI